MQFSCSSSLGGTRRDRDPGFPSFCTTRLWGSASTIQHTWCPVQKRDPLTVMDEAVPDARMSWCSQRGGRGSEWGPGVPGRTKKKEYQDPPCALVEAKGRSVSVISSSGRQIIDDGSCDHSHAESSRPILRTPFRGLFGISHDHKMPRTTTTVR